MQKKLAVMYGCHCPESVFELSCPSTSRTNALPFCFFFQVAQYINFDFSLLESILQRLNEEEKREIQRTVAK